jgi:hypothetical protein
MASRSALITLLVAVSCASVASAMTSYMVGDNQGWTTGVDYSGWTPGKNFVVGDKLGEPSVLGELLYKTRPCTLLFRLFFLLQNIMNRR